MDGTAGEAAAKTLDEILETLQNEKSQLDDEIERAKASQQEGAQGQKLLQARLGPVQAAAVSFGKSDEAYVAATIAANKAIANIRPALTDTLDQAVEIDLKNKVETLLGEGWQRQVDLGSAKSDVAKVQLDSQTAVQAIAAAEEEVKNSLATLNAFATQRADLAKALEKQIPDLMGAVKSGNERKSFVLLVQLETSLAHLDDVYSDTHKQDLVNAYSAAATQLSNARDALNTASTDLVKKQEAMTDADKRLKDYIKTRDQELQKIWAQPAEPPNPPPPGEQPDANATS